MIQRLDKLEQKPDHTLIPQGKQPKEYQETQWPNPSQVEANESPDFDLRGICLPEKTGTETLPTQNTLGTSMIKNPRMVREVKKLDLNTAETNSIRTEKSVTSSIKMITEKKPEFSSAITNRDTQTFFTVIMGTQQHCIEKDEMAVNTIIHAKSWNRYLLDLAKQGLKCTSWIDHLRKSKKIQAYMLSQRESRGLSFSCLGPFSAAIILDGIRLNIPIYVTKDDNFGDDIHLGKDVLQPQPVMVVSTNDPKVQDDARTRITFKGGSSTALLDTGAGPSCMSIDTYKEMGGTEDELTKSRFTLTAANNTKMKDYGMTPLLDFRMGDYNLSAIFIVVENLGTDGIILGRDFIRMYDILIDIPKNIIRIRNPNIEYRIVQKHEVTKSQGTFVAKLKEDQELDAEGLSQCVMKVSWKKKRHAEKALPETSRWLAFTEDVESGYMRAKGVSAGRSIAMIRGSTLQVVLINANPEKPDEKPTTILNSQKATINVTPIIVRYERVRTGDPETRDCNAIELRQREQFDGLDDLDGMSIATGLTTLDSGGDLPIPDEKDKAFMKRPDIGHIKGELSDQEWLEANTILDTYSNLFSTSKTDIGCTDRAEHVIELVEGAQPFKIPIRRVNPEKKKIIKEQMRTLIDMGIIKPSKSPFSSAVTLVKKCDDQWRFCIDFRKLNEITVKDAFPLPIIADTIESLGSAKFFSSLDMGNAFWQVPLEEMSKQTTAFAEDGELWEWQRMPFGLCNATATFQRLMANVLAPITNKYGNLVLCYVDDIIIATRTAREHLDRIREVFQHLQAAGLKLKAAKCFLFQKEIRFLGRVISDSKIKPDPANSLKIRKWEPPRNKGELDSFLGLCGYYREFVKDFAQIAYPLMVMKQKAVDFVWNDETQAAFDQLRGALISEPILQLPTEDGSFVLDTDASIVGIAGILHQWQEIKGEEKLVVISYGSRGLRSHERNYPAAKSEMLAALTFIEYYKKLLSGQPFVLRCDNIALSWLKTYRNGEGMVARWIQRLDQFNFKIVHRLRDKHTNADGLSKMTQFYRHREERPAPERKGFTWMTQEQFDELPILTEEQLKPKKPKIVAKKRRIEAKKRRL